MTAILGAANEPRVYYWEMVALVDYPPVVSETQLRTGYTRLVRFRAEKVTWDSAGYVSARGRRILLSGAVGVTYGEATYVLGHEPPELTFVAFRQRWVMS